MSFWDEVQETAGNVKDGFLDLLAGVKDNYVEITKAVNGSGDGALASGYSQSTAGVNNTGKPLTATGNSWFQGNWLLILFAILLVVGMIAAVKWVL